jgi:hypothetical protein
VVSEDEDNTDLLVLVYEEELVEMEEDESGVETQKAANDVQ